ncbi:MAG: hypothetical protein LC808_35135 [Actinobacteria bacterium]|nr:hypothetical protein [Actinomycetota bacterium]
MMSVFTPDDEPYFGRPSVYQLDRMLSIFITQQHRIASWTHDATLSPLQRAASELVPSASSIALSIRELVRQAYLMSALTLTRPLMERVATLSYLIDNPSKVSLWERGWPHKTRPTLKQRMDAMVNVKDAPLPKDTPPSETDVAKVIDRYNSLVHGDRAAALHGAVLLDCGSPGFTVSKDTGSPTRADEVCHETVCWLVVLMARCDQLFPDLTPAR